MGGHVRRAGGSAFLLLASAALQHAGAVEILHAPDAIRVCLCLDQAVTGRSDELNRESDAYDAEREALATLESQAAAARQQLDPANEAQRKAFGQLLTERDAAVQRFARKTTPHYNEVVGRYNEAAEAFSRECGGKAYDWDVLEQVQSTLSCPPAAKDGVIDGATAEG
jgi:murein L,D-transpeptidase YcbB/YkuD